MSSVNQSHSPSRRRPPPRPPGSSARPLTSTSSSSVGGPSYDQLKLKYLTVDRNYEKLKELTRKGSVLKLC